MLVKLECYFDIYKREWESGERGIPPKCDSKYYGVGMRISLKECINCPYLRGWLRKEE